jgi:tRNA-uridine 2-sulfurtransferase
MKRVVVGLSGGVDSSVAAYLLKQEGYEVIGMFMKNWHDESVTISNDCPWIDDSNDALLIANQLEIPFQVIDLSKEYYDRIVSYMFSEYEKGRTPNPDVLCNREIKFDVFLKAALELGADFVATGHYCRKTTFESIHSLRAGIDNTKDQSYFLCQLNQEQLSKSLFPIGNLLKTEVRQIAEREGLITANKKDSQGLCFVGKISLPTFLQQQLSTKEGKIIEVPCNNKQLTEYHSVPVDLSNVKPLSTPFVFDEKDGVEVAKHIGAHYYTVGQRKGLHIGGRPSPSFVLQIDTKNNIVFSGLNEDHKGLNRWCLKILKSDIHYVNSTFEFNLNEPRIIKIRTRYRQELQNAQALLLDDGLYVLFDKLQKAITPGQFAAIYEDDELFCSGVIYS